MKRIIAYILAVFAVFAVFGQNPADMTKVYFRIGYRYFEPSLGNNRAEMDRFVDKVRAAGSIDSLVVRAYASPDGQNAANVRLTHFRCESIVGYLLDHTDISRDVIHTFPEGVAWDELRSMVAENTVVPSREKVLDILDNTPVWVFDSRGRVVDGRKKRLMDLDGGKPYRWLFDNIFPQLRNTVAVSFYVAAGNNDATAGAANAANTVAPENATNVADATNATGAAGITGMAGSATVADNSASSSAGSISATTGSVSSAATTCPLDNTAPATEIAVDTKDTIGTSDNRGASNADGLSDAKGVSASTDTLGTTGTDSSIGTDVTIGSTAPAGSTGSTDSVGLTDGADIAPHHRFALKTNIPYYGILMPNLELAWLINKNWSVAVEGNVAWWSNEPLHKCYRLATVAPEVHYWIRPRAPWHGMYVGLFAGGGWYDLENGGIGYRGEGGMAGVSFGYMWPVSRRLSFEAAIGAGYMYTRYKEYEPFEGHYLYLRTKSMNYFGPLKVKFSLVWRFNDINKPKKSAPAL